MTINIGVEAPVPPPPAGHQWKAVVHKNDVSWLAGWQDTINTKDWKYVQLAATSSVKSESDQKKYEKARELKKHIDLIRADYKRKMLSKDVEEAQLAVTTFLVDKLALRAGGEKDADLADTVGVCTLRVGHVKRVPPATLKFDFLVRRRQQRCVSSVAQRRGRARTPSATSRSTRCRRTSTLRWAPSARVRGQAGSCLRLL